MVKRIGGTRRKSRHKTSKNVKRKGKISLTKYFQKLEKGDRVKLKIEPAVQKGAFHLRFHGKSGVVKSKIGKCYKVMIKDGKKEKELIVHPIHLKK